LPIVATRVGGNPELVRDGESGFLVPFRNPGALAEKLAALLSAPDRAREMGARGRRLVESELSLERMADGHGALYRRALGSAPLLREQRLRPA
jgi:glycosyltransferase involved in cell wall biosynthesis